MGRVSCGRRLLRAGAPVWLLSLLVLASCSGRSSHSAPIWSAGYKPPAKPFKVVVLRMGEGAGLVEPSDKDIEDGLKEDGFTSRKFYTLESRQEGDVAKIPDMVDAAVKDGADVLIAFNAETARVAAERSTKTPVCFGIAGSPFAAGLAKDRKDHKPNVTGAFIPFEMSYSTQIAHASLPKAKTFGILFNPDDAQSVAHKDALVLVNSTPPLPLVFEEFHADSEAPAAAKKLIDQKVDAIFLTHGIGPAGKSVIEQAREAKIPVFGFTTAQAEAGAAFCRVPSPRWCGFEAGRKAVHVLEGETAQHIDLREGTMMQTVVNQNSAKAFGVQVPGGIMREAKVIGGEVPVGAVRPGFGSAAKKK